MYEYKIFQFLSDVSPETCKAVYLDLDYRKVWDEYVKGKLIIIKQYLVVVLLA